MEHNGQKVRGEVCTYYNLSVKLIIDLFILLSFLQACKCVIRPLNLGVDNLFYVVSVVVFFPKGHDGNYREWGGRCVHTIPWGLQDQTPVGSC